MLRISTRIYVAPILCGKACGRIVGALWQVCGQNFMVSHNTQLNPKVLWISPASFPILHTNYTHVLPTTVYNFTSVTEHLYTLSTLLTNITTTYINKLQRSIE